MARRTDPHPSDARSERRRRGVRVSVAVRFSRAADAVSEAAVFSARFAAPVPTQRFRACRDPVSAAFGGADRRNGDDADAAVRRLRHRGRHDDRHGSASRGARVGGSRVRTAARYPDAAVDPQAECVLHDGRDPVPHEKTPAEGADRQRKPAYRTGQRASGDADRRFARASRASDPVPEADRRGHAARRASDLGHAAAVRRGNGGLLRCARAGTDRMRTGDPAGASVTV